MGRLTGRMLKVGRHLQFEVGDPDRTTRSHDQIARPRSEEHRSFFSDIHHLGLDHAGVAGV